MEHLISLAIPELLFLVVPPNSSWKMTTQAFHRSQASAARLKLCIEAWNGSNIRCYVLKGDFEHARSHIYTRL